MDFETYLSHCPACSVSLTPGDLQRGLCGECECSVSKVVRDLAATDPDLYSQQIADIHGKERMLVRWAEIMDIGRPILYRAGVWVVTEFGVECLILPYPIAKERLNTQDWVEHVSDKTWVNRADFQSAFNEAKRLLL